MSFLILRVPTTGNIPDSLRYLHKLTKVDLAHNMLEGSVPGGDARWINSMSIILLNNNKLSGELVARCQSKMIDYLKRQNKLKSDDTYIILD